MLDTERIKQLVLRVVCRPHGLLYSTPPPPGDGGGGVGDTLAVMIAPPGLASRPGHWGWGMANAYLMPLTHPAMTYPPVTGGGIRLDMMLAHPALASCPGHWRGVAMT